jgi:hypothetical protein
MTSKGQQDKFTFILRRECTICFLLKVLIFIVEYAASPNIEAVQKSVLEKADKQIRVGIFRTDIDSIWAELYEKVHRPSMNS